jgi:cytochrome c-type biogenesis protein CcmH
MKFNPFSKSLISIFFGTVLILVLTSFSTKANIENDIKKITLKLRCMTCQNQTIYSSDTDFSLNIKKIIKNKLENNETEKEIINFLIYRYGEYILFEPRMNKQNLFLWFSPFLVLAISLVFFIIRIKKNP